MAMVQPHQHYLGAAHSFEIIVPADPVAGKYIRPDVTILKTFFINDKKNINDWQATWEGLKLDAVELPGTPLVLQEDLQHPKFSVQEMFDRGTIFDYDIDEENHQIIVYVRITDLSIVERIKSGELQYVSPAVISKGSETMHNENGIDVLDRTLPLHLAIVGDPAYGKDAAKMSHLCSGNGEACYNRLKMMTASRQIFAASDDCVERKIKILADEHPEWKHDQVVAVAFSYCKEKSADAPGGGSDGGSTGIKSKLEIKNADGISALEQIPYIKKMLGTTARIASTLTRIKDGTEFYYHNGISGRWINVQGKDVFVAQYQTIKSAMAEQCGCTKLAAEEEKWITVNGVHILIKPDQTKDEAVKEFLDKQESKGPKTKKPASNKLKTHAKFVESVKNSNIRISSDDVEDSKYFTVESLSHKGSFVRYKTSPELSPSKISYMIEIVEDHIPDNWSLDMTFHGKADVHLGKVGDREFKAAGTSSHDGRINIWSGGFKESVIAHEIGHQVWNGLEEMADHEEEEEMPETPIANMLGGFEDRCDELTTPTGFTTYMDEYITAGDARKYTEVFAAIAQKDTMIFGKQWRTKMLSKEQQARAKPVFDLYDKLRKEADSG